MSGCEGEQSQQGFGTAGTLYGRELSSSGMDERESRI